MDAWIVCKNFLASCLKGSILLFGQLKSTNQWSQFSQTLWGNTNTAAGVSWYGLLWLGSCMSDQQRGIKHISPLCSKGKKNHNTLLGNQNMREHHVPSSSAQMMTFASARIIF